MQGHPFIYVFFILQEGTKDIKEMGKQSVCYTIGIWAINAKEIILSGKEATHIPVVVPMGQSGRKMGIF